MTKDKNAIRNFHALTPVAQKAREHDFLLLLRARNPKLTDAQIKAAMRRALASMKGRQP